MDYSLQAPLSMGFSRQEYRSGLPFPSPGILFLSGFVDDESKSKTMEKKIPAVINFLPTSHQERFIVKGRKAFPQFSFFKAIPEKPHLDSIKALQLRYVLGNFSRQGSSVGRSSGPGVQGHGLSSRPCYLMQYVTLIMALCLSEPQSSQ